MQARDLKNIIESENHELKTQFCNVPFTITPDRNIYNIIRNKYKELALEAQTKFAEINEQFEDLDDLINNAPSAFVYCIEKALLEQIQDIISVDIYTIDKEHRNVPPYIVEAQNLIVDYMQSSEYLRDYFEKKVRQWDKIKYR